MPYDSSQGTFAVSLHLDDIAAVHIASTIVEIAEATVNRFITESHVPPHITLGAFHADMMHVPRLIQLVEDFSRSVFQQTIQFVSISHFEERVLFAEPIAEGFLKNVNKELHALLAPEFESGENGFYLPSVWHPHCTLATRLSKKQFAKAQAIAQKIPLPIEADAVEMSVFQCHPFAEARRFPLPKKHGV